MNTYEVREENLRKLKNCNFLNVTDIEYVREKKPYVDYKGKHFAMITRYRTIVYPKKYVKVHFRNGESRKVSLDDTFVIEIITKSNGDTKQIDREVAKRLNRDLKISLISLFILGLIIWLLTRIK